VSLDDKISTTIVVNGISNEESSTFFDAEQAVLQVVLPESELGKRKIQDEFQRVEIRLHNLQCYKMEMECEQMRTQFSIDKDQLVIKHQMDNIQKKIDNRISTVNSFAMAMEMLDPQWRDDKGLVLQTQDYMKNAIFNGSSTLV